jgi:hypothetical protein
MDEAVKSAKRAILGLGDCRMDANGVLTKISAGRNREIIFPNNYKKIEKKSIVLYGNENKIKFCEDIVSCKQGVFEYKSSERFGNVLTVDLGNMGFKVSYNIGKSIHFIGNKLYDCGVTYIFSDDKLVEQVAGIIGGVGYFINIGIITDPNAITVGHTTIWVKGQNIDFLKQVLNFPTANNIYLNASTAYNLQHIERFLKGM